jgi:hypothetical protein
MEILQINKYNEINILLIHDIMHRGENGADTDG